MSKTILIIEDEASIKRIIKAFLEDAGYSVISADDGISGIGFFTHKGKNRRLLAAASLVAAAQSYDILVRLIPFIAGMIPDKIPAHAGMPPSAYQSGQLDNCYSHMEKRGSRYLRYALYNAARIVADIQYPLLQ